MIYADGTSGSPGDLVFQNTMGFTNPLVLQAATSLSPGTNQVTLTGGISGMTGLTKYVGGTICGRRMDTE